jgi:predicted ATPase
MVELGIYGRILKWPILRRFVTIVDSLYEQQSRLFPPTVAN